MKVQSHFFKIKIGTTTQMVEGGKLFFLCQVRMEPQGLVADEPTTNSSAQDYRSDLAQQDTHIHFPP